MNQNKPYLSLQPSEGIVVQVAGQIYAAYISSGRVTDGDEDRWMKRSIREAIQIAKTVDEVVQSDDELG
jgi:hypothetical protein